MFTYRLIYLEICRKLHYTNYGHPSRHLLYAYFDLFLTTFYYGRFFFAMFLTFKYPERLEWLAQYSPMERLLILLQLNSPFILVAFVLIFQYSIVFQLVYIFTDKTHLTWQILGDIFIRITRLYLASKPSPRNKLKCPNPNRISVHPILRRFLALMEKYLPWFELNYNQLINFANHPKKTLRFFPNLKPQIKFNLMLLLSVCEIYNFIIVSISVFLSIFLLLLSLLTFTQIFSIFAWPLFFLDFTLFLYATFILFGTVSVITIFIACNFDIFLLWVFKEVSRSLRIALFKSRALRFRVNLIGEFERFTVRHNRLVYYVLSTNRYLSLLVFFFVLHNTPGSILWVNIWYFTRNNIQSASIRSLLVGAILGQACGSLLAFLPMIRLPGRIHEPTRYLTSLQLSLAKNNQLASKFRILKVYESLHTVKKINTTVGPLAAMTSKLLLEFMYQYCTYLMMMASIINGSKAQR